MNGIQEEEIFPSLPPKGQITLTGQEEEIFPNLPKKGEAPLIKPEPLTEIEEKKGPSIFDTIKNLAGKIGPSLAKSAKHLGSIPAIMEEEGKEKFMEEQKKRAEASPYKAPTMGVPSEALKEWQEKEGREAEIFQYQLVKESKKEPTLIEGGMWSRDPKVNEISNKLSYHLPWWLTGFASPAFVATYEALKQIPNIALTLKEKSEYDPLAERHLEELGSDEFFGGVGKTMAFAFGDKPYANLLADPDIWRKVAYWGEEAARLIISGLATGKMTEAMREKNINKVAEKMKVGGYSENEIKGLTDTLRKYAKPDDFRREIERMTELAKTEFPSARVTGGLPEGFKIPAVVPRTGMVVPPRRITPPIARYATEKTVLPAGMTEAERIAQSYAEAAGRLPEETTVNIKPQADGSVDVTLKKPTVPVAETPKETPKELAMGSFLAAHENYPRILYGSIEKTEAVKKGVVTPKELVDYIEANGKEVVDKPTVIPGPKEKKAPVKKAGGFKDPVWQAIADEGGVAPDQDFSRNYLMKDLGIPAKLVKKSGKPMDQMAASLSQTMPRIEDSRDLEQRLLAKKKGKAPTEKETKEELDRRAEEEYERFKEEEIEAVPEIPKEPERKQPPKVLAVKEDYGKWFKSAYEGRSKAEPEQLDLFSEQKPEESALLYRGSPILKDIEKVISEGKELSNPQKKYLEEQGMYQFKAIPEEKPMPEIEEEVPVKEGGLKLARMSVVTPTGRLQDLGYLTEEFVGRVKDYAKQLGLEGKLRTMETKAGKWPYGSHFAPLEQAKYMKGILRDVKYVPKEEWKKWEMYSGYPFTKEVREAIDRIRAKGKAKKRVQLEELREELQKTDEGKVEWMFIETELELKEKRKSSFSKAFKATKRALVDTSGNIKKDLLKDLGVLGKEATLDHDLAAGASSKAERLYEEASKGIFKGLSKDQEQLLNRAIQNRRTIAVSKYKPEVKHPHGLKGEDHEKYLKTIPEEINKKADLYFKEMEKVLGQLKKEGLIDETNYENLKSKGDYSPRVFIQHIDPDITYTISGKLITVPSSGLKALDEGSYRVMETDSRKLLSNVISRTQNVIFRNRANVSAYNLAEEIPDNGIFKLAKVAKTTEKGKPVMQKAPAGWTKIKAMVDGKPKEILIIDKYAKEWLTRDPLINEQIANLIGWLSGSKILKPMATGVNPGFAITNFPRDIAHIWITTSEYSSLGPMFTAQMGRDLLSTMKDAFTRKGRWIDYLDEGGGMYFLTQQGKTIKTRNPALRKLQDVLAYVGETSEIWTRIALRERAIRKGKSPKEATWIARNYLDFSQGGNVSKALDSGIPYLNAGIQGTRGIFRALGDRPTDTLWKFAQLGALASGLYLANHYAHKEGYDRVPDREKVNNFVIMTPFKERDKNGNERHLYFKVAKDQGQRIVCTIFENLMKKYLGEPVDGDQIGQAVQEFIPIIPSQNLPPSIDALMGYFANKDFWRNEDIWRGPKVTPREEYTAYTHPALVEMGKKTGLSPEKTKYVLQQFFTYGNIYTSVVGGALNLMFKEAPEKDKRKITAEILTRLPIIRRFAKLTPPYSEEELKQAEKVATEESTRRYKQRRELNKMSNEFYRKLKDDKVTDKELLREIKVFIKQQPKEDQDRLYQRFKKYELVYDIPDKSWWLDISNMPPEARATVFWTKYMESKKEEKEELIKLAKRVPGIWSDRFYKRLKLLLKKSKEE